MAALDKDGLAERQEARVAAAFLREQRQGIDIATKARLIALGVILGWALWLETSFENLTPYFILALLAATGLGVWGGSRTRAFRPWMLYAAVAFDHALIAAALVMPMTIGGEVAPAALNLRSVWFPVFFLFIGASALAQSPALVVFSGAAASIAWSAAVVWVVQQPGSFTLPHTMLWYEPNMAEVLRILQNPNFVDLTAWVSQVLLLLLVSLVLAMAVQRSRRLVMNQIATERERANLARYFSPDMVDRLANKDSPLSHPQTRAVAVLFADLTGFTRLCENSPPDQIIELLRGFRLRMERAVFDHGGTVDKYIGDCVMATFGLLTPSGRDPAAALACARAMQASVADWNRLRTAHGLEPIGLGIGLHYGVVVAGDIGSDRRLEFTVIGDTVNVASRLMHLTRELDTDIVISDEVAGATLVTDGEPALDGFHRIEEMPLRGRDGTIALWYHRPEGRRAAPSVAA
ncbi:adenylate/guanylate cyclase domain-containing protein [Aerophototrophica crusticola]|uniref:Adenylate/guanylate cyclase domain-containing protein n=1 Tax=Aerophototrophica crusticola TaxID=1709002 RepID=A0A858R6E9_9PROT|nr:adenylate/guanylate cyclase domain-containing protein [Rhodospirillaceae bacterium B3]